MIRHLTTLLLAALLAQPAHALDDLAERYVHLALELGEYDSDYVDAYQGPPEWRQNARQNLRPKAALAEAVTELQSKLQRARPGDAESAHRRDALLKNVRAMHTRLRLLLGEQLSFAEEARLIYDIELPQWSMVEFDRVLADIEALVPGEGDLAERVDAFYAQFDLPRDRVEAVVRQGIDECRRRTARHIALPENEKYTLEFVTGTSWGGYNWYQGDNHSLVQVNLDFPVKVGRAIGLGCHEGYPGHHLWNMLVENRLLKERGWIEHSVFPLFSPSALVAEGSANYGVDLAFPENERIDYEREVLFPLAGLDPELVAPLHRMNELSRQLRFARNAIAQRYLDGEISRDEAIEQSRRYGLTSREKAEKSVRFIEQYRSYVLNYSLGQDLVQAFIERQAEDAAGRWRAFERMLIEMPSASELAP